VRGAFNVCGAACHDTLRASVHALHGFGELVPVVAQQAGEKGLVRSHRRMMGVALRWRQAGNKKTRHEGGFSLRALDPCLRRDEQR
jgi:hypothetical protein